MTSVASETVAFSSRTPHYSRSTGVIPGENAPFSMMLDASFAPAEAPRPAPRPTQPASPAAKTTTTTPADPKTPHAKAAPETPEGKSAETAPATDATAAAEDNRGQPVAAETDASLIDTSLPEIPEPDSPATDDGAVVEAIVVQVQTDPTTAKPVVTPEAVIAAVAPAPDGEPPAPIDTDGEIASARVPKPAAGAANIPNPAAAPTGADVTPADAPLADAPGMPVTETHAGKSVPAAKAPADMIPAEQPPIPAEQTPDAAPPHLLPQQAKADEARPQLASDDVTPERSESTPQRETQQASEPASSKPVFPSQAAAPEVDRPNAPLPQPHQPAATDVASLTTANPRAATMMAQVPVPVSGIAVEITAQARAGNNRFEIRLDPPELGRIDVRLDIDQDGNVKSRLVIERSDTYDLLRRDASTLERALQQAGLKTSENGLEFTLRDHTAAQREAREENQRQTERGVIADAEIMPAEAANGYARVPGLGTGVDIRI